MNTAFAYNNVLLNQFFGCFVTYQFQAIFRYHNSSHNIKHKSI